MSFTVFYFSTDGFANSVNFHSFAGFFPIAVDISEDPNCPPKHREAWAEKLYFILFVKQASEQKASENGQLKSQKCGSVLPLHWQPL